MNALETEIECMDPADFWRMHASGWHHSGDVAEYCHLPNLANFYYDLEGDAEWFLVNVLGVSPN